MQDLARNPGLCPDWGSNQRPFGLQAGTQSTEPHQPGPHLLFLNRKPTNGSTEGPSDIALNRRVRSEGPSPGTVQGAAGDVEMKAALPGP